MNQHHAQLDFDRLVDDNVSRYGSRVTRVLGDQLEPDHAYTIGVRIHEHPEVVCIVLPPRTATGGLHELYRRTGADRHTIGIDAPDELFGDREAA
jgi:hypothetical protein